MSVPYSNRTANFIIPAMSLEGKPKLSRNCSELIDEVREQVPKWRDVFQAFVWLSNVKVRVTFTSASKMEDCMNLGLTFRRFPLLITPVSTQKWVTILRLAYGIPDDEVRYALSQYGVVSRCKTETHMGMNVGVRSVLMQVITPIPSQLKIRGHSCLVFYKGQRRTCFKCGNSGHQKSECPVGTQMPDGARNRNTGSTDPPPPGPAKEPNEDMDNSNKSSQEQQADSSQMDTVDNSTDPSNGEKGRSFSSQAAPTHVDKVSTDGSLDQSNLSNEANASQQSKTQSPKSKKNSLARAARNLITGIRKRKATPDPTPDHVEEEVPSKRVEVSEEAESANVQVEQDSNVQKDLIPQPSDQSVSQTDQQSVLQTEPSMEEPSSDVQATESNVNPAAQKSISTPSSSMPPPLNIRRSASADRIRKIPSSPSYAAVVRKSTSPSPIPSGRRKDKSRASRERQERTPSAESNRFSLLRDEVTVDDPDFSDDSLRYEVDLLFTDENDDSQSEANFA